MWGRVLGLLFRVSGGVFAVAVRKTASQFSLRLQVGALERELRELRETRSLPDEPENATSCGAARGGL